MAKPSVFVHACTRSSQRLHQIRPIEFRGDRHTRQISNYIRDVIRTGSLYPENPLVKALDSSKPEEYLPRLPLIETYHVKDAIAHVQAKQASILARHQTVFSSSPQDTIENESSVNIASIVQAVNDMEEPAHRLRQICVMIVQCGRADSLAQEMWKSTAGSVFDELPPFQSVTTLPIDRLQTLQSWMLEQKTNAQNISSTDAEMVTAARLLLSHHQDLTGVKDVSHYDIDGEDATKYVKYSGMLHDIEESILSTKSMEASSNLLRDVYNFIGIRREQAKLLGYENDIDQALSQSTVTSLKEIEMMHNSIEEHVVPKVRVLTGTKTRAEQDLALYLSPTSSTAPAMSAQETEVKKDEFYMMKLEKYVTLDGALQFLFQLLNRLSGVSFRPLEEYERLFDSNTLVFGAYDGEKYLGTIVLDPFQKSREVLKAVAIPVFAKSSTMAPLVCLSLSIQPPTWDDDPVRLTWEDCESLFHEMGHILQLLCGKSELGCVVGPELLPGDVSEFLSKVSLQSCAFWDDAHCASVCCSLWSTGSLRNQRSVQW